MGVSETVESSKFVGERTINDIKEKLKVTLGAPIKGTYKKTKPKQTKRKQQKKDPKVRKPSGER